MLPARTHQRVGSLWLFFLISGSVASSQSSGYTVPTKAVKLDSKSIEAVLSAKTVAITAHEHPSVSVTSVDPAKKTATVVVHGGIRRGVDADKARKSVRDVMQEWGRLTVVDSPAEADLVLVVIEDSVPPSNFSKMNGDVTYRLRDRLGLFRGGEPEGIAQPLWVDISTESTFGALTGSSAGKVAKKFRADVEKLSKHSK